MIQATGYRKTAIAQVRITPGEGKITINEKTLDQYFTEESFRTVIFQPLKVTKMDTKLDIIVKVMGSGNNSQAEAIRHGIARALIKYDPELRSDVKKEGFLTRDARKKERRKYGFRGARKARQYRKR